MSKMNRRMEKAFITTYPKVTTEWGIYYLGTNKDGSYFALKDKDPSFCFEALDIKEVTKKAEETLREYSRGLFRPGENLRRNR
jgi:hypothetical protein